MCDYCGNGDGLICCEVCEGVWFTRCAVCGGLVEWLDTYNLYDAPVCKKCF